MSKRRRQFQYNSYLEPDTASSTLFEVTQRHTTYEVTQHNLTTTHGYVDVLALPSDQPDNGALSSNPFIPAPLASEDEDDDHEFQFEWMDPNFVPEIPGGDKPAGDITTTGEPAKQHQTVAMVCVEPLAPPMLHIDLSRCLTG